MSVRLFRKLLSALLLLPALLCCALRAQAPVQVSVAAAADLRVVMDELQKAFQAREPGIRLALSFGASGSLTAQIRQGAPFDLFLSADMAFPEQLHAAGLGALPPRPYALGSLVLWVRRGQGIPPAQGGLGYLRHVTLKRIAIANPRVAPYGRAAMEALLKAGLLPELQERLTLGENVAQAAQYLAAGAAQAGLISQSQASAPPLDQLGAWVPLPQGSYAPLRQGALLLARSRVQPQARAFLDFLLGPQGQAILSRHGFGRP